MRGLLTGIVLGIAFLIPFGLVAGTFQQGQEVIVCLHEEGMRLVMTEDECLGEARQGTVVDVTSEYADVQVGEEVVRVPLAQ